MRILLTFYLFSSIASRPSWPWYRVVFHVIAVSGSTLTHAPLLFRRRTLFGSLPLRIVIWLFYTVHVLNPPNGDDTKVVRYTICNMRHTNLHHDTHAQGNNTTRNKYLPKTFHVTSILERIALVVRTKKIVRESWRRAKITNTVQQTIDFQNVNIVSSYLPVRDILLLFR